MAGRPRNFSTTTMSFTPFDPDSIVAAGGMSLTAPAPVPQAPAPVPARGLSRPLDRRAKWHLSQIAEAAYEHLAAAGKLPAGEDLEHFRHRIAIEACGRRISQATLADRMPIQAAFLALKDDTRGAARATAKATDTEHALALYKLRQNLRQRGLTETYAETLAWRFYKLRLSDCSPRQLWTLTFTVRNNHKTAK